jgi:hypothetical protein
MHEGTSGTHFYEPPSLRMEAGGAECGEIPLRALDSRFTAI